ncbi:hypothetical protein GCM10009733_082810 [Nonomuraea maheshkhaliensis]|uniref:Uncharacterized protein n=1 Tax=Nonomuraea maheshkhaliensis TaxID=419590 RepID=A0ABN2GL55_9ACTN
MQPLRKAKRDGLHHLVLDGTLIHIDRVKADRPYFSLRWSSTNAKRLTGSSRRRYICRPAQDVALRIQLPNPGFELLVLLFQHVVGR